MLVAAMTETYQRVRESSMLYWLFERAQLIQEFKRKGAMPPPLNILTIIWHDLPLAVSFVDVRKAYFNGVPRRRLHLFFPKELGLEKGAVAHLKRCVYGARDAGMIWEDCYAHVLVKTGFRRGIASPCCFFIILAACYLSSSMGTTSRLPGHAAT